MCHRRGFCHHPHCDFKGGLAAEIKADGPAKSPKLFCSDAATRQSFEPFRQSAPRAQNTDVWGGRGQGGDERVFIKLRIMGGTATKVHGSSPISTKTSGACDRQ